MPDVGYRSDQIVCLFQFLNYMDFPGLFLFIFVFSMQLIVNKFKNFADDWIQTVDLWCQKRPLYQLSHNHCPILAKIYKEKSFVETRAIFNHSLFNRKIFLHSQGITFSSVPPMKSALNPSPFKRCH